MNRDAMYGYMIKALENKGLKKEQIQKIFEEMMKLQDEMEAKKAQTYYYDLYD